MRAIRLSEGCLTCHGDPATSPFGDGKDALGFPMEGWKAGYLHGAFEVVLPSERIDEQIAAFTEKS